MWASGDGAIAGEMAEAAFLLRVGWTWLQYEETPDWVIRDFLLLLNAEAEVQKAAQNG